MFYVVDREIEAAARTGRGAVKTPPKLFRIGEVAEFSGFSRQTIHNYTHLGLIREADRTRGDHRLYDERVFARLERIKELRKTHTLKEIQRLLEGET
jgi:DNA-binding transcriptional MerR regulator